MTNEEKYKKALEAILAIDPLSFIDKGDAATQSSWHLQKIIDIVEEALK